MTLALFAYLYIGAVVCIAVSGIGMLIEIGYVVRDIWRRRK